MGRPLWRNCLKSGQFPFGLRSSCLSCQFSLDDAAACADCERLVRRAGVGLCTEPPTALATFSERVTIVSVANQQGRDHGH